MIRAPLVVAACATLLGACAPVKNAPVAPRAEASPAAASPATPPESLEPLEPLLRSDADLAAWLDDAERRRLQVLVAIPDGAGTMRRTSFRADAEYFYPASAVKLCVALAALEKLEELRADVDESLSMNHVLRFTYGEGRTRRVHDTTLRREIELALVISSNEAFNRLLDFVGTEELAERLSRHGISSAHIAHRLGEATVRPAPVVEMIASGRTAIPIAQRLGFPIPPGPTVSLGTAHRDERGRLVREPLDFSDKNAIPLRDLQDLLIGLFRTEEWLPTFRTNLIEILGTLPSGLPGIRGRTRVLDARYKPLAVAITNAFPDQAIRVYGKGGRAYGFAVENAYVMNETTGRSFFVSATIYANGNDVLNDDRYEYDAIAEPFISRLGVVLAEKLLLANSSAAVAERDGEHR